jgi:hypothetical protein
LKHHSISVSRDPSVRGLALLFLTLAALSLLATTTLQASHFRFAHITWKRITGTTVEFTSLQAWRADADETLPIDFGDGERGIGSVSKVSSGVDAEGEAFLVTRYTVEHTYSSEGPFLALVDDCCRIGDLVNAPDAGQRMETVVDLRDGNLGSPVGSIPVILQMSQGRKSSLILPVADPDGDTVTCRLSTSAESQIPEAAAAGGHALTVSGERLLEWNTAGTAVGEKYAVQVMLEENHAEHMSHVALDFIVEIVAGSENPPECSGDSRLNVIPVGQEFTASFTGTDVDGDDLTFTASGVPPGAVLFPPPGTSQAQPLAVSFQWTPTPSDDRSSHAVTIIYKDTFGRETACSLSLQVENCALVSFDAFSAAACDAVTVELREADGLTVIAAREVKAAGLPGLDVAYSLFHAFQSPPSADSDPAALDAETFDVGLSTSSVQFCRPGGEPFRVFVAGEEVPPGGSMDTCGLRVSAPMMSSADSDHDGVLDNKDCCPEAANALQEDCDLDGAGDACDAPGDCELAGFSRRLSVAPLSAAACEDLDVELREADGATTIASRQIAGLPAGLRGLDIAARISAAFRGDLPEGLEAGPAPFGARFRRANGSPFRLYANGIELKTGEVAAVCGVRLWLEEPGCPDQDQDNICDSVDNCPGSINPSQLAGNGNGEGDGCPNRPPDGSRAQASPDTLWPPNHKFAAVEILGVSDPDGDQVTIKITSIRQDEPVSGEGIGSGTTCPDGVLIDVDGDGSPEGAGVRAERSGSHEGHENGRVYTLGYTASDGRGGEISGLVKVSVPHDRDESAVDDGSRFNSTLCPSDDHDGGEGEEPAQQAGGGQGNSEEAPIYPWARFQELTPEPLFIRGDSNWDEEVDLSDALMILQRLFKWAEPAPIEGPFDCHDASDVNDDGNVDLSDAIQVCSFLFLGTYVPPPPLSSLGPDPTLDDLLPCE